MRWTKVAAFAATGTLALAACGGGGDSSEESSGADPGADFAKVPASAGLKPDAKGPAAPVKGAKKGGTLTINTSNVVDNMDPSTQYFSDSAMIHRLTTRALTQYKMEGKKSVLVPDLATDLGKQSKDGMAWTFTLKKGIKYEDGTPIKASDIQYSVERSFETKAMPAGPTYQIQYLKGGDTYKGPWTEPNKKFPGIESDDKKGTITFNLRRKFVSFPYFASFTMFGPIPKAKDTKLNYQNKWLATGPYKVQKYAKGSSLALVKNTNWDPSTDPSRHQYPDKIQINFGRDKATVAKSIMADNGPDKTTLSYDGVDSSIVQDVQGPKKDQVATGPSPCNRWSGTTMDVNEIPLEVRKAVVAAWPTRGLYTARQQTTFDEVPGGTISSPQIPGFKEYKLPEAQSGQGAGDPDKAREMLKKAGKTGFELSYYYTNDTPVGKNSQKVVGPALKKAGFKVKAIGIPEAQYRAKIKDPKAPTNMGNGVATGWCYDWPSGDAIYPALFDSSLPKNGGVGNIKDKKLDAEMRRIAELPLDKQGPEWSKFDKKVVTEIVPMVPMWHGRNSAIFGTQVNNVQIDPNNSVVLSDIWVG